MFGAATTAELHALMVGFSCCVCNFSVWFCQSSAVLQCAIDDVANWHWFFRLLTSSSSYQLDMPYYTAGTRAGVFHTISTVITISVEFIGGLSSLHCSSSSRH